MALPTRSFHLVTLRETVRIQTLEGIVILLHLYSGPFTLETFFFFPSRGMHQGCFVTTISSATVRGVRLILLEH
jgi:hypothetical protein